MDYKIRLLNWHKRRKPPTISQPIRTDISNIELIDNSYCDMVVHYDDGRIYKFRARVSLNPIKHTWTVHGFSSDSGRQCLVDVII